MLHLLSKSVSPFQPLKDRNSCQAIPTVLKDIVECLETMPGTGSMEVGHMSFSIYRFLMENG